MAGPTIEWESDQSLVLIHPLLPRETQNLLAQAVAPYGEMRGHLWVASSGTENFPKMIALSKEAFLLSAQAVNFHLQIEKEHSWLNILPLFHVGGLGIHARTFLSKSAIFDMSEKPWDPVNYVKMLGKLDISHSSLTPTHVYDLVHLQLPAPKKLKAIIVGGGELSDTLHEKALSLGWPLLKSYGMTEACSQIATALTSDRDAHLSILKHVEISIDADNFIGIKSAALLTGYVCGNDPLRRLIDPKIEGWFKTQDKGELRDGVVKVYGRGAHFMKIAGESINFSELETKWENIKLNHRCHLDCALIDLPDERLGRVVCLAVARSHGPINLDPLLAEFRKQVLPIAKIRAVHQVDALPRTELYKLKKSELRLLLTAETCQ